MKTFYVQYNIGKVKYAVSMHDGVSTHNDGSPFFGIYTTNNKKKLKAYTDKLKAEGYSET